MANAWAALADHLEFFDWRSIARPEQLPPEDNNWSIWLYLAGRGAGKTRAGCEAVREWVETGQCRRIGLISPTSADARDVLIEGASGLLAISPDSNRPIYEPSKRRLTWPNGAIATIYSAEEEDRLRGPQHDGLLVDELAAMGNAQAVWDQAMFGLRVGKRPRAIITTTPRPLPILKALLKRDGLDVRVTRGRTVDNAKNLAPTFLETIVARYAGTRLGRQELDAEMLDDVPGALWSRDLVEAARMSANVGINFKRVVVAIDPATTFGDDSDSTGIIVAGLGWDDKGYVLEDLSGKYAPVEWSRIAIGAYRRWQADRIVAETNQGGAMVEATLRAVDRSVPYKGVHASRGKMVRAEPISAMYEQRRVHHLGAFNELEDEMCGYAPGVSDSPDRMDALVWALTDLMVEPMRPQFVFG
jgi:phage terminase large subunit-like protein